MYVMSVFYVEILYLVCNNIIIDMIFRTTFQNSICQIDDLCSSKGIYVRQDLPPKLIIYIFVLQVVNNLNE